MVGCRTQRSCSVRHREEVYWTYYGHLENKIMTSGVGHSADTNEHGTDFGCGHKFVIVAADRVGGVVCGVGGIMGCQL
ncbi:hypothetical protein M6B38_305650 [Iris pallida]|uniref:Uncharacterized protein n=1 Tax=Iris pallida TaxID=29817 RepID=A0AAX6HMW8_IRIPA|nr:hypothetical protein M6B38_305650 [Iris pallida]